MAFTFETGKTIMQQFEILNREMTPEEIVKMNSGFDQLSLEEGVELESSEKLTFVALNENTFVGCASGSMNKNGDSFSGWFFLSDLFVEKEFRSQGLGSELLKAMEERAIAKGMKHIWLWTSGAKSLRFYARHGYEQFTSMESWYSDGSSRVGLRKNLSKGS